MWLTALLQSCRHFFVRLDRFGDTCGGFGFLEHPQQLGSRTHDIERFGSFSCLECPILQVDSVHLWVSCDLVTNLSLQPRQLHAPNLGFVSRLERFSFNDIKHEWRELGTLESPTSTLEEPEQMLHECRVLFHVCILAIADCGSVGLSTISSAGLPLADCRCPRLLVRPSRIS